jgi:hypothetical protein
MTMTKAQGPELSRVARAARDNDSLRATIPREIVRGLEIAAGDVLRWELEGKSSRIATVKKLE